MSLFPIFRKKVEDGLPLSVDQEGAIDRAYQRRRLNWIYDMIAQLFVVFVVFAVIIFSFGVILEPPIRNAFFNMLLENLPSLVIGAVVILKLNANKEK